MAGTEGPALRFFFYGTLIAGSDNAAARAGHNRLRPIGAASVRGMLWAIPDAAQWYPALVAGSGARVHGVLYAAMNKFGADELARLDEWEDFRSDQPAASLYLRQELVVTDTAGVGYLAQVYRYNQPLPADAQAIPDGDFQAWLRAGQKEAFRG